MLKQQLQLNKDESAEIRKLIYDSFGIHLGEEKQALLVGRLQKYVIGLGYSSFREFIDYLKQNRDPEVLSQLANLISTNHTYFWRENGHFDFLAKRVLPEMTQDPEFAKRKEFYIWCAGCSTGEEPYTLAMLLLEHFHPALASWDIGILATDISLRALETAKAGIYPEDSLQQVPIPLKNRYFTKERNTDFFSVVPAIREQITYRRFNLMNETLPFRKKFHVIFCRNVMIYFDNPTKEALVERYCNQMHNEGYLFIGHSETLGREHRCLKYIAPAVYQKQIGAI